MAVNKTEKRLLIITLQEKQNRGFCIEYTILPNEINYQEVGIDVVKEY